ncbi:MAG: CDP-glycerol glycerophosphotransferase family protein [Propionibacteriaceae bacterium]|jgi:CDP-glycerol glycerophosphotransferase|nr:CDP-glycerol glycerophosphotransferase family protein [Propionibacteriaceae bacterium]
MAAGFDFASGNRAKLAALPRYAVGQARGALSKRDPRSWVVGSDFGLGDGAWAFYQAAKLADPGLRVTWLVSTAEQAEDAARRGVQWLPRDSRDGYAATLKAGVVAVTHGFGDANRFAQRGAKVVQLWHGAPLKKLHLDSPAVLRPPVPGSGPLVRGMYRVGLRAISLFPVCGEPAVAPIESAFGLPAGRVLPLGEPRTDILFGDPGELAAASRELWREAIPDLGERRLVLHAPTWRDGQPDPVIPSVSDLVAIEAWCAENDALLVIRPHPKAVGDYPRSTPLVRVLSSREQPYPMPLLWGVDALVTDYSSILVDFAVTGRPILALAPDLAEYSRSRGLYFGYDELFAAPRATTWPELLEQLGGLADPAFAGRLGAHSAALRDRFQAHQDGQNAARVVAHILHGLS